MRPFFNNPINFSFKDALALCMCGPFIVAIVIYMVKPSADYLTLISTLIPIVVIVLGGYFGQEVATSYFTKGQMISQYGSYGGYGGYTNYGQTTTPTNTTVNVVQGPP